MQANTCPDCYVQDYPECTESITVSGDFVPGTTYLVKVADQFNNSYHTTVMADYAGNLAIPTEDFPIGLFNRFSGAFKFEFYSEDGCDLFQPVLCEVAYPCLLLSFIKTVNSDEVDFTEIVGCCDEIEEE